jgi:hypothetical protein
MRKGSAYCTFQLTFKITLLTIYIYRDWLGWNLRTYRSRNGHCRRFCDASCTLPWWRTTFQVVWRVRAVFVFESAVMERVVLVNAYSKSFFYFAPTPDLESWSNIRLQGAVFIQFM